MFLVRLDEFLLILFLMGIYAFKQGVCNVKKFASFFFIHSAYGKRFSMSFEDLKNMVFDASVHSFVYLSVT